MHLAQWSHDGEMTKKIDDSIMALICTASLPLSFVEEPAVKNLLKILAPMYKIR